jgi:hypothetical protein
MTDYMNLNPNAEMHMMDAPANINEQFANSTDWLLNQHIPYEALGFNSNASADFLLREAGLSMPETNLSVPYDEINRGTGAFGNTGPTRGANHPERNVPPSPTWPPTD